MYKHDYQLKIWGRGRGMQYSSCGDNSSSSCFWLCFPPPNLSSWLLLRTRVPEMQPPSTRSLLRSARSLPRLEIQTLNLQSWRRL